MAEQRQIEEKQRSVDQIPQDYTDESRLPLPFEDEEMDVMPDRVKKPKVDDYAVFTYASNIA